MGSGMVFIKFLWEPRNNIIENVHYNYVNNNYYICSFLQVQVIIEILSLEIDMGWKTNYFTVTNIYTKAGWQDKWGETGGMYKFMRD